MLRVARRPLRVELLEDRSLPSGLTPTSDSGSDPSTATQSTTSYASSAPHESTHPPASSGSDPTPASSASDGDSSEYGTAGSGSSGSGSGSESQEYGAGAGKGGSGELR